MKKDQMILDVPRNEHPVEAVYVVLAVDGNGNEGICGVTTFVDGASRSVALVTSDEALLPEIERMARNIAEPAKSMRSIKLVKFTRREDIKQF